jgi:hypothetical protein
MIKPAPAASPPEKASATARWVACAIVCCVFEGSFRKWLFPGSSPPVQAIFYFSKDGALFLAALTALRQRPKSPEVSLLLQIMAVATMLILLASAMNIANAGLVGGVLSIRAMIVYPWLALLIAPGLRSQRDLDLIARTVGYLAIPVAVLGVLQFYLPPGHALNRQLDMEQTVTVYRDRVRAFGTFTFISGMSAMALVTCWAGCYFLVAPPRRKIGYAFVLAGLSCAAAALSRSGLFFSLTLIVSVLVLSRTGISAAAFLALGVAAVAFLLGGLRESDEEETSDQTSIVNATLTRHQESDSVERRGTWILDSVLFAMANAPVGTGLGRGQLAEGMVTGGVRRFGGYEPEPARIVFEIGILGLVGVLLLRGALVLVLLLSLVAATDRALPLHYLRKTSIPALFLFLAANTVFDHVACTFAWIIATVALATFEIEVRPKRMPWDPGRGSGPGHVPRPVS